MVAKLCQICGIQGAEYTCPRCSVKYCTLACYRHTDHADCTESHFYKESVVDQLKDTKASKEEQLKMLEMLKRMYDDNVDEDVLEEDQISSRFSNINLDTATIDDMLECMTMDERIQFETVLKSQNAMQCLIEPWNPWWFEDSTKYPAIHPSLSIKIPAHNQISCTLIDLLFSYVCACRTSNGDLHDANAESFDLLVFSSYVLSLPQNNTFTYKDAFECLDLVFATLRGSSLSFSPESLLIFFKDCLTIIQDKQKVLAALSDMVRVFDQISKNSKAHKKTAFLHSKKCHYFLTMASLMNEELDIFARSMIITYDKWEKEVIVLTNLKTPKKVAPTIQPLIEDYDPSNLSNSVDGFTQSNPNSIIYKSTEETPVKLNTSQCCGTRPLIEEVVYESSEPDVTKSISIEYKETSLPTIDLQLTPTPGHNKKPLIEDMSI